MAKRKRTTKRTQPKGPRKTKPKKQKTRAPAKSKKKPQTAYKRFVNVFNKSPLEVATDEVEGVAYELSAYVKEVIYSQRYKWKPLNPKYKAWKAKHNLDDRILLATHTYINAIQVRRTRRGKGYQISVGVPTKKGDNIHEPSGMTFKELARLHEFGSHDKKIPARPHWRPAKSWLSRNMKQIRKRLKENVGRKSHQAFIRTGMKSI